MIKSQKMKFLATIVSRLFVTIAIVFFLFAVYNSTRNLSDFQWNNAFIGPVLIVILVFICINMLGALIWHLLLSALGEKHSLLLSFRIYLISQIGKYIPGNVAHLIGRVSMAKTHGMKSSSVSYTIVFELLMIVLSSTLFSIVTVLLVDIEGYSPLIPNLLNLVLIGLVCVTVALFIIYFSPRLFSLLGKRPFIQPATMVPAKIFLACFLIYIITFGLFGYSANHIAEEIFGVYGKKILLTSGIFTISFVAGFLTPGSPAGIGVREAALIILLSPIYGDLCAVGIAAFTRIAQMAGDCISMLLAVILFRKITGKEETGSDLNTPEKPSIIYWGTYDLSKPRNPILLDGLRDAGCRVTQCHKSIWGGNNDKSQLRGGMRWIGILFGYIKAYPGLIWRFLWLEKSSYVFVGYLGHLDVLILWPFAKLKGTPIVWDAFISMYNTIVEDRMMVSKRNPVSYIIYCWEWLGCRAADTVLLDTKAHADYFKETYGLRDSKVIHAFVGVDGSFMGNKTLKRKLSKTAQPLSVLFYGTFIPLHGIETIIRAARLVPEDIAHWTIVGRGQEADNIESQLKAMSVVNLTWIPWIPYTELTDKIMEADVCLGIFGDTQKSSMVIPNKVFQVIACGKPLITRDSPAIRELITPDSDGVWLVPPEDENALAKSVIDAFNSQKELGQECLHAEIEDEIQPKFIAGLLIESLAQVFHDHFAKN